MSITDTRDIAPAITNVPASPAGAMATEAQALPLSKLALLGTMGRPDARIAILRERDGTILTVVTGTKTPAGTVQAIGEGEIILARSGKATRLRMPN